MHTQNHNICGRDETVHWRLAKIIQYWQADQFLSGEKQHTLNIHC